MLISTLSLEPRRVERAPTKQGVRGTYPRIANGGRLPELSLHADFKQTNQTSLLVTPTLAHHFPLDRPYPNISTHSTKLPRIIHHHSTTTTTAISETKDRIQSLRKPFTFSRKFESPLCLPSKLHPSRLNGARPQLPTLLHPQQSPSKREPLLQRRYYAFLS